MTEGRSGEPHRLSAQVGRLRNNTHTHTHTHTHTSQHTSRNDGQLSIHDGATIAQPRRGTGDHRHHVPPQIMRRADDEMNRNVAEPQSLRRFFSGHYGYHGQLPGGRVVANIEARWLVNGGHGASLRRHNQLTSRATRSRPPPALAIVFVALCARVALTWVSHEKN
jgi:hypothetical protein